MKLILDTEIIEYSPDVKKIEKEQFYENTTVDSGIHNVEEPSELAEVVRELNDDRIREDMQMSDIDMKSRLHSIEVPQILAVDSLVSLNFLPPSCLPFTRQKKRLSVSLNGEGRNDIIKIVAGKRELEGESMGKSMINRLGGIFGAK